MSHCCVRCKKEKEENLFKNEKNKVFKQCNDCREYNRNKKNDKKKLMDLSQIEKNQEPNKKWKEENRKRIILYNKHRKDLKDGKKSNWKEILNKNGFEENKIIGNPSHHRKEHSLNEKGEEGKECCSCELWKKVELYNKNSKSWDLLRNDCKDCLKEYRKKNKEKSTEYNKEYWIKTQEQQKEKNKNWRENNKEYIKKKLKEYREIHGKEIDKKQWQKRKNDEEYKKKHAVMRRRYENERLKTDVKFRLKQNVSRRIREILTNFGIEKSEKTIYYVGCNLQDLRKYLENKFQEGMSWQNYGKWHIDHIIPCSSWNLVDVKELKMCFHYSNLQTLWASENIKKKDYFDPIEKDKFIEEFNKCLKIDGNQNETSL